jgi:hypothetical protein
MLRISHILNPVAAQEGSELAIAQPITFATLLRAKEEAKDCAQVNHYIVQYAEDGNIAPVEFKRLPDLTRSIRDFGTFQSSRRLPVFTDILKAAYDAGEADYIVYTNADIAAMPFLYRAIATFAKKGYDAFAINRRCISSRFSSIDQLDEMYAEVGHIHTGYDTIVFRRELFPKFNLGNVCIGIPFFDTILMYNLYAFSKSFRLFTDKHLTFHIGLELVKKWGDNDQYTHNTKEYLTALHVIYPHLRIENIPGAGLSFFRRHYKWLMNPTFHYPTMLRLDLSQIGSKRRPYPEREIKRFSDRWYSAIIQSISFPGDI